MHSSWICLKDGRFCEVEKPNSMNRLLLPKDVHFDGTESGWQLTRGRSYQEAISIPQWREVLFGKTLHQLFHQRVLNQVLVYSR